MSAAEKRIRVLYSFPHKLGAQRICYVAWQQVNGLVGAGANVLVFPGVLSRPLPPNVHVRPTLAWKNLRIPYKVFGRFNTLALHDYLVSRELPNLAGKIDIIHTWPLGALRTLRVARSLGIPTVLERPNAHTAFAYQAVERECKRLGITMPSGHEHAWDRRILRKEEEEYRLANGLLCPSDFVVHTFLERGFPEDKLMRHQYGFDEKVCYPASTPKAPNRGLTVLFAGGCAPRKGLHHALEAWLQSSAHHNGTFLIVGDFIPGYAEKLSSMLAHPSIRVLGFRKDLADVMRKSDALVLPSIEEGSALVTSDARACGCVLLVSDATGAICQHMKNALVHRVGDVTTLAAHMSALNEDRQLLQSLRTASLSTIGEITWTAAAVKLLQVYRDVLALS